MLRYRSDHVEHRLHQRARAHRRTGGHSARSERAADLRIGRPRAPARDARLRRPADHGRRSAADRAAVPRAQDSVCRARPRHRIVGRRAAAARRRADRAVAAEPHHRRRHPEPAHHGRAGRHQPRRDATRRAARLLLRARSVEPADLLDRRQRRRKFRRRALPEVRLHGSPRARRRGGAAQRRDGAPRRPRARCARPRSARRARRLGGHAGGRDEGDAADSSCGRER